MWTFYNKGETMWSSTIYVCLKNFHFSNSRVALTLHKLNNVTNTNQGFKAEKN